MSTERNRFWGRFQSKAGKADPAQSPFDKSDSISTGGQSLPSTDSGYGSLGSSAEAYESQKSALKSEDGPFRPPKTPASKLPITVETHRLIRNTLGSFKTQFGGQLMRHLNASLKKAKDISVGAVAILPSLAWSDDDGGTVEITIILQCHPSAEPRVRQFLKEHRLAIETSFRCLEESPQKLRVVALWIVGQELIFLGATVYSPAFATDVENLGLCGKPIWTRLDDGTMIESTLGGFVSVNSPNDQFRRWFGVTTAHGLQRSSPRTHNDTSEDEELNNGSTLTMALKSLSLSHRICHLISNATADPEAAWLSLRLRSADKGLRAALSNYLKFGSVNIESLPSTMYFRKDLEEWMVWLDSVLERHSQALLSSCAGVNEEFEERRLGFNFAQHMPVLDSLDHVPLTGHRDPKQQVFGDVLTTSDELIRALKNEDMQNLDWTLIQSATLGSNTLPRRWQAFDVFNLAENGRTEFGMVSPGISERDMDSSQSVVILNERRRHPLAKISPQPVYLCVPPGIDFVDMLACSIDEPSSWKLPDPVGFGQGDSGSWAISMDEFGRKSSHGQLTAQNCLGEWMLMPMDAVVANIKTVLSPIYDEGPLIIELHLPIVPLYLGVLSTLSYFSPNNKEKLKINMPMADRLLVWKMIRLSWEAARSKWKTYTQHPKVQLNQSKALHSFERDLWMQEEYDWRKMDLRMAANSVGLTKFKDWLEIWEQRKDYWARSLWYWSGSKEYHYGRLSAYPLKHPYPFLDEIGRVHESVASSGSSRAYSSPQSVWSYGPSVSTAASSLMGSFDAVYRDKPEIFGSIYEEIEDDDKGEGSQ